VQGKSRKEKKRGEKEDGKMGFENRKFSMNYSTGTPRVSTKINRRFSSNEKEAGATGM
jgi:hypothetical protein